MSRWTAMVASSLILAGVSHGANPLLQADDAGEGLMSTDAVAPLRVLPARAGDAQIVRMKLDADAYFALPDAGAVVRMDSFPLTGGRTADLQLERFDVVSDETTFVIDGELGERHTEAPDVVLLRGVIADDPESVVFLGLSPHGTNGVINTSHGETVFIAADRLDPMAVVVSEAPIDGRWAQFRCGVQPGSPYHRVIETASVSTRGVAETCRTIDVAVDTDYEFSASLFGGDTFASQSYAIQLFGAVATIYERDVDATVNVSYLRVWDSNTDPYTGNDGGEHLNTMANVWQTTQGGVDRDLAHLLSAKNFSDTGGVAWLGVVCSTSNGYAVSGHLDGSYPQPLQDNRYGNWDVVVVAHEMGHQVGTGHTHDSYSPTIDDCGNGNCTGANQGTIMSYCHTCSGGISNIRLRFHPRVIERIEGYLAGRPCLDVADVPQIVQQPQDETVLLGESASFSVIGSAMGGVTYQWRRNGIDIPGATADSYSIAVTAYSDAGAYSCAVSSECATTISLGGLLVVEGDDCNTNGFADLTDVASGFSEDCNVNGNPDECDIEPIDFVGSSPEMEPIGLGHPQSYTFSGLPPAREDVDLTIRAAGDFSSTSELVFVSLNGVSYGNIFLSGASDCSNPADSVTLTLTPSEFNSLVDMGAGQLTVDFGTTSSVDPFRCPLLNSWISAELVYGSDGFSQDLNQDGQPDECDSAADCAGDLTTTGTTNGVPDGQTNLSDLQWYLTLWQGDDPIADVNSTGTTNGMPDSEVNLSDLQFYLTEWTNGTIACP